MDDWLVFCVSVLNDFFTLDIGDFNISSVFLAIACVGVVSSALLIKIRR